MIWITNSMQDVIKDMNLHHITIFTNYAKNKDHELEYFYQSIVKDNPTITIDFLKMEQTIDNRILKMPIFKNPRQSTTYIILQTINAEKSGLLILNDTLNKLAEIAPVKMRPKCLVIFSNNANFSQDESKTILQRAWSLKFLDFTILKLDSNNDLIIEYNSYNPFTETYSAGYLKTKDNIFPDKLIDVNKYPLKLSVFELPPYLVISSRNDSNINVNGNSPFIYLKAIAEKLNFQLNFVYNASLTLEEAYLDSRLSVSKSETSMTPMAYNFEKKVFQLEVLLGDVLEISTYILLVPIQLEYAVFIPYDVVTYVATFISISIIFIVFLRALKLKSERWGILNVFRVLIGTPTTSQPEKNIERIIFLTIALLSIIYTNEFFSKITDVKVSWKEKDFENFDEIYNSKIPVYHEFSMKLGQFESEDIKKFISYSHEIDDVANCIEELIRTRNVICILPSRYALYCVKNNLDLQGKPIMKTTDLSLNQEFVGFLYEKSSPFIEKFNKLMLQMVEFALFPDRELGKIKLQNTSKESANTNDTVIKIALSILFIGLFLSTLVFIHELRYFSRFTMKFKKNILKMFRRA